MYIMYIKKNVHSRLSQKLTQSQYTSIGEWIKKMCIYTIEYCTAMKNKMNYYHIHIRTQMNFRNNAEQIILFNFQNWGKQIYG